MTRHRLTNEQKRRGVATVLLNSAYEKTAHNIGLELGFANGKPIYDTLCELHKLGIIEVFHKEYLGKPATYFLVKVGQELRLREFAGTSI